MRAAQSTIEALRGAYYKLSVGGVVIVDDWRLDGMQARARAAAAAAPVARPDAAGPGARRAPPRCPAGCAAPKGEAQGGLRRAGAAGGDRLPRGVRDGGADPRRRRRPGVVGQAGAERKVRVRGYAR
jgi:hypothetical protein